jgi:hypothetical protein
VTLGGDIDPVWVGGYNTSGDALSVAVLGNYEFRSSMCSALCLNWWVSGDAAAERIPEDFPFGWARRTRGLHRLKARVVGAGRARVSSPRRWAIPSPKTAG